MIDKVIRQRREHVYLILSAFFLASMTLLNVIGITKFIHIGPLALAIGVLPYPLTFLCTDLICEIYGKERAKFLVWLGLALNVFVILILYIGQILPGVDSTLQPPWQTLFLAKDFHLANGELASGQIELYKILYACTAGSVFASMLAYLTAQFCDVYLFHFWKNLTKGKHLWLRNNGSTTISQLVDSAVVISVTFGALVYRGEMTFEVFAGLMASNYLFKFIAAVIDTGPFYLGVFFLRKYLLLDSGQDLEGSFD